MELFFWLVSVYGIHRLAYYGWRCCHRRYLSKPWLETGLLFSLLFFFFFFLLNLPFFILIFFWKLSFRTFQRIQLVPSTVSPSSSSPTIRFADGLVSPLSLSRSLFSFFTFLLSLSSLQCFTALLFVRFAGCISSIGHVAQSSWASPALWQWRWVWCEHSCTPPGCSPASSIRCWRTLLWTQTGFVDC